MATVVPSFAVSTAALQQSVSMPLSLRISQLTISSRACSSLSSQCLLSRSSHLPHRPQYHQASTYLRSRLPIQQSRTFLIQLKRQSQTLKEASTTTTNPSVADTIVTGAAANEPPLQLTNLPYFVRRTASNQLPVYLVTKAGGTKQETKIQKTEGDLDALRNDLARALGLESADPRAKKSPDITINRLNGHIIVKGWRKSDIQKFLLERNF